MPEIRMLPVSVIIPTKNRYEILKKTIESFLSGSYIPDQFVIIDQSNDCDIVKNILKHIKTDFSGVDFKYYYLAVPSLTKARNLGVKLAENEILICSDDDILINANTIYEVYKILDTENEVSLIAGIDENTQNAKSSFITYISGYLFLRKKIINNKGYVISSMIGRYPKMIKERIETEWAMGYFFAVRKSLLEKWKINWDENLISYAYCEDLDFSYTYYKFSKSENKKCIIDPKVKVRHLAAPQGRITAYKHTLMYIVNREYLSYKHYSSSLSRVFTNWSNVGEFIMRLIKRDNPLDVLRAQHLCSKYKKELKQGIIPKEIIDLQR